jgi:hypothetical protein
MKLDIKADAREALEKRQGELSELRDAYRVTRDAAVEQRRKDLTEKSYGEAWNTYWSTIDPAYNTYREGRRSTLKGPEGSVADSGESCSDLEERAGDDPAAASLFDEGDRSIRQEAEVVWYLG